MTTVPTSPSDRSSFTSFDARAQGYTFPERRVGVNSSGAKVERPISPHVTIYAQSIPAISSITNRVSGTMLSVGLSGAALVALFGSCDLPGYVLSFQHAAPALVPVVKAVVAWPVLYHTLAAVRHLLWDYTARGLDLSSVELTSKLLIAASIALSLGAAAVTIAPNPHSAAAAAANSGR